MTWPPLRPSLGWQQPLMPHRILHRQEQLRRFRYKSCPSVGVAPSFVSTLPDAIMMISGERGEFFKPDCRQSL